MAAAKLGSAEGLNLRVVSAPCLEWFNEQSEEYRQSVIPKEISVRVSVEAGIAMGWRELVGDHGSILSLERFGASASGPELFKEFGFTAENVLAHVKKSLASVKGK